MATDPLTSRLTYSDYCLLPEDGRRHEILAGEHFMSPAPSLRHQALLGNLFAALHAFLQRSPLGRAFVAPVDVLLSEHDVVQPDLVYVSRPREGILTEANVQGAPDLVVEILSAATRQHDLVTKRKRYARFGVAEYWVVDPVIERVEVYRREGQALVRVEELSLEDGATLDTPFLPGFALPLSQLFG
jgi:Uma2 family endonuclease